jgi:hypothetical protein
MNDKTQEAINKETHSALFGINGEPGIVQQVREMAEILSAFRLFGKAVMWIALFLGSVGTAVGGVIEGIKYYHHK